MINGQLCLIHGHVRRVVTVKDIGNGKSFAILDRPKDGLFFAPVDQISEIDEAGILGLQEEIDLQRADIADMRRDLSEAADALADTLDWAQDEYHHWMNRFIGKWATKRPAQ